MLSPREMMGPTFFFFFFGEGDADEKEHEKVGIFLVKGGRDLRFELFQTIERRANSTGERDIGRNDEKNI